VRSVTDQQYTQIDSRDGHSLLRAGQGLGLLDVPVLLQRHGGGRDAVPKHRGPHRFTAASTHGHTQTVEMEYVCVCV